MKRVAGAKKIEMPFPHPLTPPFDAPPFYFSLLPAAPKCAEATQRHVARACRRSSTLDGTRDDDDEIDDDEEI